MTLNGKKRRKGTFLTTGRGKTVPLYLPSRLFQAREENRKTGEATLPAEISHTLVFLPGNAALLVLPLLE